jgi:hypothetical protein
MVAVLPRSFAAGAAAVVRHAVAPRLRAELEHNARWLSRLRRVEAYEIEGRKEGRDRRV